MNRYNIFSFCSCKWNLFFIDLSLNINHRPLFHITINIHPDFYIAEGRAIVSLARLDSVRPVSDCDRRNWKWREMTFGEMAWHYPIMVNGGGEQAAASFKCHFGNSGWPQNEIHFGPLLLRLSSSCFLLFWVRWKTSLQEELLTCSYSST